jgi:hypothetical protein
VVGSGKHPTPPPAIAAKMLSLLSAVPYFAFLYWLLRRHPAMIAAQTLLLFSFTLRVICTLYIDLFGPIYSTDLGYDLGPGFSTSLFAFSVLSVLLASYWGYRRLRIDHTKIGLTPLGLPQRFISNVALAGFAVLIVANFSEMLASGHVPLLEGMDRLEYAEKYGTLFYAFTYEFHFLLGALLGYLFTVPRLTGGQYDYRFAAVLAGLIVFFMLTGNRFSIFVVYISYFLMGWSALLVATAKGVKLAELKGYRRSLFHFIEKSKALRQAGAALCLVAFAGVLLNSFFNVRYGDAELARAAFFQRSLVQPVELYEFTWQRLRAGEITNTSLAWDLMFNNPIDATRNTGIQFLMVSAMGEKRATDVLEQNSQSAGGYPEVLIELFGTPGFLLPMAAAAMVYAFLLHRILLSAVYGRLLTVLASVYILVGFSTLYTGGMLNFLLATTFWIKISLWLLILLAEPYLMRLPRRRSPRADLQSAHSPGRAGV